MNKKQVDEIVQKLLEDTQKSGESYSRERIREKFCDRYSKDQMERIIYRYEYLLSNQTGDN